MSLKDHKVDVSADYMGRDISSLEDRPNISSEQLKARFDSLVKDVVVPKYNALIDEMGEPAHRVKSGIRGNILCFDDNGDISDGGISVGEIEPGRVRGSIVGRGASLWYRVAAFHIPASVATGRNISFEGYSSVPTLFGRGHWKLTVALTNLGDQYRQACRLELADKGISSDSFSFRKLDRGEYVLWFKAEADTDYSIFARPEGDIGEGWFELFDNDTTEPYGDELTVEYSGAANIMIGRFRALVSAESEYTDVSVDGARENGPVVVTVNDASPKVMPKSAVCSERGVVRIYWEQAPVTGASVYLSMVYSI